MRTTVLFLPDRGSRTPRNHIWGGERLVYSPRRYHNHAPTYCDEGKEDRSFFQILVRPTASGWIGPREGQC